MGGSGVYAGSPRGRLAKWLRDLKGARFAKRLLAAALNVICSGYEGWEYVGWGRFRLKNRRCCWRRGEFFEGRNVVEDLAREKLHVVFCHGKEKMWLVERDILVVRTLRKRWRVA